jgi:DNA-directed RNA polymerase subunit RPC12/RpoP
MQTFNLANFSSVNILPILLLARQGCPVVPLLGLAYRDGEYVDAHVHPDLERPPDDETEAVSLLIGWRWPWGWRCERCHHRVHTRSAARPRQIRCAGCGDRRSVTAGTALQKKHDLPRWFAAAIALGSARQASARRFAIVWDCNYKTAWSTMHVLRKLSPAPREPHDQKGTWTACHDSHACRTNQPRGEQRWDPRRNRHPRFGGFLAMGPNAVYFVEHQQSRSFSRVVQQLAFPTGAVPSDAKVLSRHGRAVIAEVHRTVSTRWAKRYLDALAQRATWIRQGDSPAARMLNDALRAPPRPWAAVAP